MSLEKLRVFIAIDVEDPLLLSRLERIKEAIIATGVPMKPVETHNLHLTLRFIGEVPRYRVEEIIERVLKPMKKQRFTMTLKGLGAFPSPSRPRVVWVGVSEETGILESIHEEIEMGLRSIGFQPARERFVPHITLARIRGSRNIHALIRVITEYSDYEFGSMTVTSIRLKKSTLTPRGPIYETLWEVPLA